MKRVDMAAVCVWVLVGAAGCTRVREQPAAGDQKQAEPSPSTTAKSAVPVRRPPPPPPSAPPAPAEVEAKVPADTLNGDPAGLKKEALNAAMQGALPALGGCFQGPGPQPPSVSIAFDVLPAGGVDNVRVDGASPDGTRCVTSKLGAVRFPEFKGDKVPVTFPLSIYSPPQPKPAPVAEAPAPAPAAPAPPAPPPTTTLPSSSLPTLPTKAAAPPTAASPFVQP